MRNKLRYWWHRFILRAFCVRFVTMKHPDDALPELGISILGVPFLFYRDSEPLLTDGDGYTVRPVQDKEYGRSIRPIR